MALVGYRIAYKSTSQVRDEDIDRYDFLAQIVITKDKEGIGSGELMLVDKDKVRSPITWQGWVLSSKISMEYGRGSTDLHLNITDPLGNSELIVTKADRGCMSSGWGVSLLSATISTLNELIESKSWEHHNKYLQVKEATKYLNDLMLKVEDANVHLNKLKNELKSLG